MISKIVRLVFHVDLSLGHIYVSIPVESRSYNEIILTETQALTNCLDEHPELLSV